MVAQESALEAQCSDDGSDALFNRWVPGWIKYKYTNLSTRTRTEICWTVLSQFLTEKKIFHPQEVTYQLCHDYAQWRVVGADGRKEVNLNTAKTELKRLSSIMGESVARGWVQYNPCHHLRMGYVASKEKRAISREEEAEIFTKLKGNGKTFYPWMADAFLVGMRQGCRLAEVEIPLDKIDTDRMVVKFKTKGGRFHAAPLHKDLLPLVIRARAEKQDVLVRLGGSASVRFCNLFKEMGLKLCFHCTRVTVVSRLCEAGFSESQTMAYVGHSSTLVHALYRKMRPVAVSQLCDAL